MVSAFDVTTFARIATKRIALVFLFGCGLFGSATASAFDLKGVQVGDDEAVVRSAFGAQNCRDPRSAIADIVCMMDVDFAGKQANLMVAIYSGRVASVMVHFDAGAWADVRGALVAKFGQPDITQTGTVQNAMGVTFDTETITWRAGDLTLVAKKRAGKVTEGTVEIQSAATAAEFMRRRAAKAREDAAEI